MKWETVLADLDAKVGELERCLEIEAWEELEATPFAPPDVEGEMTPRQRERAADLLQRVADCRRRIEGRMADSQEELDTLDARRKGARSYVSSEAGV